MAYSDYGGRAYRNKEHRADREDAVLNSAGIQATPGMYPGFAGIDMNAPRGHAILGDGPIFVTLYKQSDIKLYRAYGARRDLYEELDLLEHLNSFWCDGIDAVGRYTGSDGKEHTYFNTEIFKSKEHIAVFTIDNHQIEVWFMVEDNHYMYVRLKQPDGTVWHGWSGYGVGAGFENGEYGYRNEDRDETMKILWHEDF